MTQPKRRRVDRYVIQKLFGAGGHGSLWRGRDTSTGREVSVRIVERNQPPGDENISRLQAEIATLRRISHPNVVRLLEAKKTSSHVYLILDHCVEGDVAAHLRKRGRVPEDVARHFVAQITSGLSALHRADVLHGDLQPCNVLMTGSPMDPVLKITNIGGSGAPSPYASPEVLAHGAHTFPADVWPLGVMLCELIVGRRPFVGVSEGRLLQSIDAAQRRGNRRLGGALVSPSADACELIASVLQKNPRRRPTAVDLLRHPYLVAAESKRAKSMAPGRCLAEDCNPARSKSSSSKLTTSDAGDCLHLVEQTRPLTGMAAVAISLWMRRITVPTLTSKSFCRRWIMMKEDVNEWWKTPAASGVQAIVKTLERIGLHTLAAKYIRAAPEWQNSVIIAVFRRGLPRTSQSREATLATFIMGQLRSSHMFRLRTARMCPQIMYASIGWDSVNRLLRWNLLFSATLL